MTLLEWCKHYPGSPRSYRKDHRTVFFTLGLIADGQLKHLEDIEDYRIFFRGPWSIGLERKDVEEDV